jgi:hypothetical protein
MAGSTSGDRSSARSSARSSVSNAGVQSLRGVVQSIEWVPRQADVGVSGAAGAAAVGGAVPGLGSDRVYRITLRTDDGSTQSVLVDTPPDYNVGDRVSYSNGSIQRQ